MRNSSSNNLRIAKNTIFLYFRMFVTMALGLFTSRVILNTLGVEDFGVYNVVGGVVVLFSFISSSLRNATQRFLSYEIGMGDLDQLNKVFSTSLCCHIVIGFVLFFLCETVGLWFLNNYLNIPQDRYVAANWVYQFSIFTFIIGIIQVPFNAAIISFEKMSFYAYVSIIEVVLKLLIVYMLFVIDMDKLIIYAGLLAIVSVVILLSNVVYCKKHLELGKVNLSYDNHLFKKLMGFSGWSMLNGSASLFAQQGGNILLNMFNGVVVNAAFGIANQVTNAIYSFVFNFQYAFQPQIVKLYASNEKDKLYLLINRASSISFYLLLIIAIPFCAEVDYIINLWLGVNPQYATIFCELMIVFFLLDSIQAPLWMLIYAIGEIKSYTIWTAGITFLNIPLSLVFLYLNYPVYIVFVVRIILNVMCCIYRMFYLYKHSSFSVGTYLKNVALRSFFVALVAVIGVLCFKNIFILLHPLWIIFMAIIFTILVAWSLGISRNEKNIIINFVKSKIYVSSKVN